MLCLSVNGYSIIVNFYGSNPHIIFMAANLPIPTGRTTMRDAATFVSKSGGSNLHRKCMVANLTKLF